MLTERTFALEFWPLRELDRRLKSGRLFFAGWHGLTMCHISPFELAAVKKFMAGLSKRDVACFKTVTFVSDGDYKLRETSVWLRREEDMAGLVALLHDLPKRAHLIEVDDEEKFTPTVRKMLKGINYDFMTTGWPGEAALTIEDSKAAAIAKMFVG